MKLTSEVTVARPADELFAQLSDLERVAPCLPGVILEGTDGDEHLGRMAIRVGPISATYRGRLRFVESDAAARRTVMRAVAEEINGHGSAEAQIATAIHEQPDGASRVVVETDLQLRGRVAQFGRGAIGAVAERLLGQFARNLEALHDAPEAGATRTAEPGPAPAGTPAFAPDALRLGDLVGARLPRGPLVAAGAALAGFAYGYLAGALREARRRA